MPQTNYKTKWFANGNEEIQRRADDEVWLPPPRGTIRFRPCHES